MIEGILPKGCKGDATKRSCRDCRHCKAAVSWWCTSKEAVKAHGSRLPGIRDCSYWEPCRSVDELSKQEIADIRTTPKAASWC